MPSRPHLDDRRDARPELQIRAGAVQHLDAVLGQQRLLGLVDPHAVRRAQTAATRARTLARYSRLFIPPVSCLTMAISSRDSDAWVCTSMPCSPESDRHRFEQRARARHGEARRERGAEPSVRARRSSADGSRGFRRSTPAVRSCRRAGTAASRVHHALADRRRADRSRRAASNTTSVSCTVSIVSTVVVPARAAARWPRAAPPRRSVRWRRAPLPSATRACAASPSAADRRRSRERASDKDECASG